MNQTVNFFLKNGFLIAPDAFNRMDSDFDKISFLERLKKKTYFENLLLINQDVSTMVWRERGVKINWIEFDNSRVMLEKNKEAETYNTFLSMFDYDVSEEKQEEITQIMEEVTYDQKEAEISDEKDKSNGSVVIVKSYNEDSRKRDLNDFVSYFKKRYDFLKDLLLNRQELQDVISIKRLLSRDKTEKGKISLIGLVYEKSVTKNGNIILKVEDKTGMTSLIITKNNKELFDIGNDIVLDEVIGINGYSMDRVVFVNNIYFPDIPLTKELKKSKEVTYVAFISDLHVGDSLFLEEDFENFLEWINGNCEGEEKEIVDKIEYLFIPGDTVAGIGIYPGQEEDLTIKDINKQYQKFSEYMDRIPCRIKIIICAGNHDALRISEPQPQLEKNYLNDLYKKENVFFVTNPSLVNIHSSKDFEGFDVLIYHGYSIPYFADNVESIRAAGGQDRSDLVLKFLLQRRHLAPTHTSNLYVPDPIQDHLLIDRIPDFFITGHIHRMASINYRNITALNCGCWVKQSEDQKKRGIVPDPSKAFLINLQTREIKIKNFGKNG